MMRHVLTSLRQYFEGIASRTYAKNQLKVLMRDFVLSHPFPECLSDVERSLYMNILMAISLSRCPWASSRTRWLSGEHFWQKFSISTQMVENHKNIKVIAQFKIYILRNKEWAFYKYNRLKYKIHFKSSLSRHVSIYFQSRKIDLRFHEPEAQFLNYHQRNPRSSV